MEKKKRRAPAPNGALRGEGSRINPGLRSAGCGRAAAVRITRVTVPTFWKENRQSVAAGAQKVQKELLHEEGARPCADGLDVRRAMVGRKSAPREHGDWKTLECMRSKRF